MPHFYRHIHLESIDPLGAGLREMIEEERAEQDAIVLQDQPDATALSEQWGHIVDELKKDPDWFSFADD